MKSPGSPGLFFYPGWDEFDEKCEPHHSPCTNINNDSKRDTGLR